MHMKFIPEEVGEIIREHLITKMGVPHGAIESIVPYILSSGKFDGILCTIKTEKAVPAGPYRTNAKGE